MYAGGIRCATKDRASDSALPAVGAELPTEGDPPQTESESTKMRTAEIDKGAPNLHVRLTMLISLG